MLLLAYIGYDSSIFIALRVMNLIYSHNLKVLTMLVLQVKTKHLSLSGTIIRGTLKAPNSQLVTPISIKLQKPDGCD
jgi:hypothetical protein